MYTRCELVEAALRLAVEMLAPYEPGDSRAASNEFVALAAISCGVDDDECHKVIMTALEVRDK